MWIVFLSAALNPRFFGFLDVMVWGEQEHAVWRGGIDAFQVSLFSQGWVHPKIRYALFVELAHGVNTQDNLGYLNLEYAFAEVYLPHGLRFRFGKQLLPWGYYNEIHDATHAFLPLYLPTYYDPPPDQPEALLMPVYGAALQLRAAFPRGEWLLFVDNGPGEPLPFQEDRNLSPGVGTRLMLGWPHADLRATVYAGTPVGEHRDQIAGVVTLHTERNRLGAIVEIGGKWLGGENSLRVALGEVFYSSGPWTPFLRVVSLAPRARATQTWIGFGLNWSATEVMVVKLEVNRWLHVPRTRMGALLSVAF